MNSPLISCNVNAMEENSETLFPCFLEFPDPVLLNEVLPKLSNRKLQAIACTSKRLNNLVHNQVIQNLMEIRRRYEKIQDFLTDLTKEEIETPQIFDINDETNYIIDLNDCFYYRNLIEQTKTDFHEPNFAKQELVFLRKVLDKYTSDLSMRLEIPVLSSIKAALKKATPYSLDFLIRFAQKEFDFSINSIAANHLPYSGARRNLTYLDYFLAFYRHNPELQDSNSDIYKTGQVLLQHGAKSFSELNYKRSHNQVDGKTKSQDREKR